MIRPILLLVVLCAPVRADMDESTLAGLVKQKKLGLSQEEEDRALAVLNRENVQVDLNQVKNARGAASAELRGSSPDSVSPFDGGRMSGGSFEANIPGVEGVPIDPKTGKPKRQLQRQQAWATPDGQCSADADAAIAAVKKLVKDRVTENDEGELVADGPYSEFFGMLGELFYPKQEKKKFAMPAVTTGKTVLERAIATYHPGGAGFITFDCEKFARYGPAMKRKIACHELYHWYQDRISALEEPSAYAVMPHC